MPANGGSKTGYQRSTESAPLNGHRTAHACLLEARWTRESLLKAKSQTKTVKQAPEEKSLIALNIKPMAPDCGMNVDIIYIS